MELSQLVFTAFYIKPPFQVYELCGQCQKDIVETLTEMECI